MFWIVFLACDSAPDTLDTGVVPPDSSATRDDTGATDTAEDTGRLVVGATIVSRTESDPAWFHSHPYRHLFASATLGGPGSWLLAQTRLVAIPESGTVAIDEEAVATLTDDALAVGDVDGDGGDDVVFGWGEWSTQDDGVNYLCEAQISVLRGPLVGALGPDDAVATVSGGLSSYGSCPRNTAAFPGDLDGDALPDVVIGGPDLRLLPSTSTIWEDATYVGPGWAPIAPGDLDGDGMSDLVVADGDGLRVYAGPWVLPLEATDAPIATGVAEVGYSNPAGDVNGDGYADLLAGGLPIYLLLGPIADGPAEETAAAELLATRFSAAADVDGDGRSDVIVGWETEDRVEVFEGPVEGTLDVGDGRWSVGLDEPQNRVGVPVAGLGDVGGAHRFAAADIASNLGAPYGGAVLLLELE